VNEYFNAEIYSIVKAFDISIGTQVLRLYLVMILVLAGFFLHQLWITAIALPVFISAVLGISFKKE